MAFGVKSARSEIETSQLLSDQRDLAAEIKRVVANISKTNTENRTAANREVRARELEVLWEQFQVSDKVLAAELPADHPYSSGELKSDTEKCVKIGREKLESWATLKAPPETGAIPKAKVSFVEGEEDSPGKSVPTGASMRHPMVPPPAPPTQMVQQRGPRAEEERESAAVPASRDLHVQPITPMGYSYPFPPFFWGGYPSAYHEGYGADDQSNDAAQTREQQPHAMPSHPMAQMGYPFAWGTGPQPGAQSGQPWAPPGYAYPWGPAPPTRNVGKFTPKLNPISIPKFNGDWQRWARFISLFENIIDSNDDLSAVEKLQYLLNYVEGKAERAIAHVRLCNENYAVALNILRRRFDNPRKICQEYVDTLFNLPKMEADSAEGINDIISALNLATEGLQQYGFDTDGWSPVIVACVLRKLDNESTRHFEVSRGDNKQVPSVEEVVGFLEARAQALLNDCNLQSTKTAMKKKSFAAITSNKSKEPNVPSCRLCRSTEHRLRFCEKFLAMTVPQRTQLAKDKNWCFNCLGEHTKNCPSKYSCSECRGKHHTLLHTEQAKPKATLSHVAQNTGQALLATALIKVKNAFGRYETFRALIDPGSQDTFITAEAADQLALSKTRASVSVSGIGGASAGAIVGQVEMFFKSHYPNQQEFHATAFVIPKLTENLPDRALDPEMLVELPENLLLADPSFADPGPIDVLLGAGSYAEIIKDGVKKIQGNLLLMQNTELGWLLTGRISEVQTTRNSRSMITISELHDKLNQFWEIEEVEPQPEVSQQIDVYFQNTTTRDSDGRYIVHLPMKNDVYGQLGGSRNMAIARLLNQEKTFAKNPNLAQEYQKFLQEYEDMGHMTRVRPFAGPEDGAYYLPHHAVVKESSTTTKVRVVFNASAKTSTGLSLNSLLEPGHKQQQDLQQIILRWRKHRFVITADIEKMFRQIIVTPAQRDLQRIVWRPSPEEPIREYQLNTVTYGTASATYLAVRTLLQLARDEGHQFPLGQEVLVRDFYMDDLMTGSSDISTVLLVQEQISALLSKGGFSIRKWTSNCREIIDQIPEDLRESGDWFFNPEATLKTLGVVWNPQRDEFRIRFQKEDFNKATLTKRALLSNIATIFDPLGFLAPISFMCKTWMQQLWTEKTDWDQEVSDEVKRKWENLLLELPLINEMRVPRWIQHAPGSSCQLHGFSDASEKGYAAVVYCRVVDQLGAVHITLLAAKTKVAPMKNKLTLPRMELAGALLLANLLHDTVKTLEIPDLELHYWCDSQITLAWIAKPPTTWNSYVGNRVAAIQEKSSPSQWKYINTKENPADVASRGCSPAALQDHPQWWSGPQWLKEPLADWPVNVAECSTDLEKRNVTSQSNVITTSAPNEIISKFSSFNTLVRVVAWIRRFKRHSSKGPRTVGGLTTTELNESRSNVLRLLQNDTFPEEINAIKKSGGLPGKSHLCSLAPFLDENGLLRVGGRLRHSGQAYNVIHPVLLPRNHLLTKAIIREAHERSLHGGAQLTLALLRRSFWISDGRSTVQSVIRSCVRCRRFSAAAATQQMGDLPASRVTPSPAFHRTGVDYCGPFVYRCSKGRGIKTDKCYISVFVCLATKAIHLELVSDLTTDAFLAALKRFVARRGLPFEIHSDNGTNFQGAAREIKAQMKALLKQSTTAAAALLAQDGVNWQFITPYSPHLGGLWEAAVKSVKKHMKRVLDDTKLTFEEFTTVLCQIEACVNSRPLFAVSNDPNDLNALTPGHFLIMRPLLARPEPAVLENNPTKRWHLLSKIHQDFWNRWSTEYLAQLQQRSKWKTSQRNPEVGELVLLKDKALPPAKWALGRIEVVHPGADKRVRLVTVRTKSGQVKQPMTNLCSLLLPEIVADQTQKDTAPKPATNTVANVAIVRRIPDRNMETSFTTDHLIVSGVFTITSDQMFDLINMMSVPAPKNGTFIIPRVNAITGILWQKLRPNTLLFTTNTSTLIAVICNSEREGIHSLFYLDQKVMETFFTSPFAEPMRILEELPPMEMLSPRRPLNYIHLSPREPQGHAAEPLNLSMWFDKMLAFFPAPQHVQPLLNNDQEP